MSNTLGNKIYSAVLKQICKMCTNFEQKQLADFVLDKAPVTKIFNISDPYEKISEKTSKAADVLKTDLFCDEILGTSGTYINDDEMTTTLKYSWTPYIDNLFAYVYINSDNNFFDKLCQFILVHRLDDNRLISFFGLYDGYKDKCIVSSVPVQVSINGVSIRWHNMVHSGFFMSSVGRDKVIETAKVSTTFYADMLKIFGDIVDQEKHAYKCYVDEPEEVRTNYYRKLTGNRETIKTQDKPILLILVDDKDIESKINKYRNPRGHIEYAFSWVVRGHYRRLHNPETVGYDRNGEKCVQGMTWVDTYLKGDPNMPLLKRETIVIDKRKRIA